MSDAFKQRSLKAVARQHKEQVAQQPVKPVEPAPQKPIARPEQAAKAKGPGKPPLPEKPKHSCGHDIPIRDMMNCPCPACRNKAREEKFAKKKASGKPYKVHLQRLPLASRKHTEYIADKKWIGTMEVPCESEPNGFVQFKAEANSEQYLLWELDKEYRKYLQEKAPKPEEKKEENPT